MGTVTRNFGHRFPKYVHNWIDVIHKSQNAPVPYPTMLHPEQKCAHFCSEWSPVGYGTGSLWDLWSWSVVCYVCKPGERVLNNSLTLQHLYELILKTIVPEVSPVANPWRRYQVETFSALLALCEGNQRSPVDSSHKGQWRGAWMFSLICAWTNGWARRRWFETPSRSLWRYRNALHGT